jgi:putative effector of murein hydrolase LrgA (UPF0299 family)
MFLAWLEWGFIRSWSKVQIMYAPSLGSALGVAALFAGLCLIPVNKRLSIQFNAYASVFLVVMAFLFLAEIVPIAQGNNDSGEVFWLIVLPAIGLLAHAHRSYLKLKVFPNQR